MVCVVVGALTVGLSGGGRASARPWSASGQETPPSPQHLEGRLPNGAVWVIDVPARWNGTLLLFSHGFGGGPTVPVRIAAGGESRRALLLDRGYALAASSYSKGGWSVEEGIPDQVSTLDAFVQRVGTPKRTIAWGESMGSLVTLGLLERHPGRFDAGLCLCGSVGGVVGMLNIGLDGAFALKTLLAPDVDLPLVNLADERARNELAQSILDKAQTTPTGRARIALAAALGQVAVWGRSGPEPEDTDYAAQEANQYRSFVYAVLTPRPPLEARAGGNLSWNTGVDYARQLTLSGRRQAVEALYRTAGLDLEADLRQVNAAPRIVADPAAVAYMKRNIVPSGELGAPLLTMSSPGDDMTSLAHEQALADVVHAAGRSDLLRQVVVRRAGHCVFSDAELLAALGALERRLDAGAWSTLATATEMNRLAESFQLDGATFIDVAPPVFLRPCHGREPRCAGEPQPTVVAGALPPLPEPRRTAVALGEGGQASRTGTTGDTQKVSRPGEYRGYSEAVYDGMARSSLYVPGDDGTKLAVDIYRPVRDGKPVEAPLPAVLVHYTGSRRDAEPARAAARLEQFGVTDLVRHGYVVAWMEPRGNGASFGTQRGFITLDMAKDAASVVEWIAAQPWCTGRVAMMGISNGGLIQLATATRRPPHLVAIMPGVANANFYYQMYPNGVSALPVGMFSGPRGSNAPPSAPPLGIPVDGDAPPDYPMAKAAAAEHRDNLGILDEWLPNMFRDAPNPRVGYSPGLIDPPIEYVDDVKRSGVKMYQLAGWFDSSPGGQLAAFKLWGGRIIVGAWPHGLAAPDQGGPMLRVEHLRWFDWVLKGIDNGIASEPPIHYQTINAPAGREWRSATDWPLPNQQPTNFYFGGARSGTVASSNDGTLATVSVTAAASDQYAVTYDIAAFDGTFNRLNRQWSGDMTPGVDVKGLTYTTAPLDADLEITGHPVAHLWVTSSAPDGNFLLYLEDVDERGVSRFVTDGVMRGSHRAVHAQSPWKEMGLPYHRSFAADARPLSATEPAELAFDLNPTSYVFRKGHRVRVTMTCAEKNTYQLPEGADTAHPPLVRVFRGGSHASFITLPVIPSSDDSSARRSNAKTRDVHPAGRR